MAIDVLLWGAVAGIVHFVFLGIAYGNPLVDRIYVAEGERSPAVRAWPSKPRYLITQFLGTQVEVYVLALGFAVLRPTTDALPLGLLFAAIRIYPRFWNMWIQSTYPRRLLAIEFGVGVAGTLLVVLTLNAMMPW